MFKKNNKNKKLSIWQSVLGGNPSQLTFGKKKNAKMFVWLFTTRVCIMLYGREGGRNESFYPVVCGFYVLMFLFNSCVGYMYKKGLDHHSPFWFDDQTVGFLSTMSGTQQLHQVGINDGVVTQVTNLPLGTKKI